MSSPSVVENVEKLRSRSRKETTRILILVTSGSAMAAVEHALRHGATITGLEKDESADEGG